MTKIQLTGLASVFLATSFLGCSREIESDPDARAGEGIRLSLASTASAADVDLGYHTFLYSERDVDVVSQMVSGYYFEQGIVVMTIHAEVGDAVKRGQLLATLDDADVQIQLEAARAALDEANANFARVELMREKEVVPQSEYDAAIYAKRYAEAELKRTELDLSRTRIKAPFSGVVSRRYIRERELIEGSTPLFRITAMAPLRARLLVPETRATAFLAGAPVRITDAHGEIATARVLVVSPTVDPGSGTREVIIELSEPNGFRPGAAVLIKPSEAEAIER
jgi:membrane fusion protein (multidrug efflux system)